MNSSGLLISILFFIILCNINCNIIILVRAFLSCVKSASIISINNAIPFTIIRSLLSLLNNNNIGNNNANNINIIKFFSF